MQTHKSSLKTSSAGAAEILSAHRLLQNQKSLIKTESLQNRKSTPEPSSTADAEIFSAQTTAEAEIIDENWVAVHPEINTGSQFCGFRWNP